MSLDVTVPGDLRAQILGDMNAGKTRGWMQTPSTGLRHLSLEEDAGKLCSECGGGCRKAMLRV